jgi:hypothetical protein
MPKMPARAPGPGIDDERLLPYSRTGRLRTDA